MTWLGALYSLLAAAFGMGLGYVFSGLLQGLLDLKNRPYWFPPLVGFFIAALTLVATWQREEAKDEIHLATAPLVQEPEPGEAAADPADYIAGLKKEDPALFRKVKAALNAELKAGKPINIAIANTRDLLDDYIEKKLPFLPDDVIIERFKLLADILSYLGAKDQNELCKDVGSGIKRSGLQLYLSAELNARDTANVTHIVNAPRDEAAPKLSPEEFKNLTNAAFVHAAQTAGIPLEDVPPSLGIAGDAKKNCRLMTGYFDAIVSMSPSEAGSALRAMAYGEQYSAVPAQPPPPTPEPVPPAQTPATPAAPAKPTPSTTP